MAKAPAVKHCGMYFAGHDVHWVQALRAGNDPDAARDPGQVVAIGDDGTVTLDVAGREERFWAHDPERFAHQAGRAGGAVIVVRRWHLVIAPMRTGAAMFSVGDPDDHAVCPAEPPTGDLFELLHTAGGFTVTGADATRMLRARRGAP